VTVHLKDAEGEPMTADGLQVRVTSGGDERTVPLAPAPQAPGEHRAEVHSLPAGVYRIEPIGPAVDQLQAAGEQDAASASFTVQSDLPRELVETRCDLALAQQIADITGGQAAPPTAVSEILELTNLAPIVTERTERRPCGSSGNTFGSSSAACKRSGSSASGKGCRNSESTRRPEQAQRSSGVESNHAAGTALRLFRPTRILRCRESFPPWRCRR
jgi:hypothetical protein